MLNLKSPFGLAIVLVFVALPVYAQTTGKANELSTVPVRANTQDLSNATTPNLTAQDLNAEERRYRRPPQRFELRRNYSPLQRLPRGNNDLLTGTEPDSVEMVDIVAW